MKTASCLLLPLLLSASAAALASQPLAAGPYRNAEMGFQLSFPAGWYHLDPVATVGGDNFCNTPDLADGSSYVSVYALPAGMTLADPRVLDAVRGDEDEDKFTVEKDVIDDWDNAGGKARLIRGMTVADGDPMHYYAVAIPAGSGRLLLLVIEGPPDAIRADPLHAQVQAMLSSFAATGG